MLVYRSYLEEFHSLEQSEIRCFGPLLFRPPKKNETEGESNLTYMMNCLEPMLRKEAAGVNSIKQSWLMPHLSTFLAKGNCNNGEIVNFFGTLHDLFKDTEEVEGKEEEEEQKESETKVAREDMFFTEHVFPFIPSPRFPRSPSVDEETVTEPLIKFSPSKVKEEEDASDSYLKKMRNGWFTKDHFGDIQ